MSQMLVNCAKGYLAAIGAATGVDAAISITKSTLGGYSFGLDLILLLAMLIYGVFIFIFVMPVWIIVVTVGTRFSVNGIIYYTIFGVVTALIMGPLGSGMSTPMFFDLDDPLDPYSRTLYTFVHHWPQLSVMGCIAGATYWAVVSRRPAAFQRKKSTQAGLPQAEGDAAAGVAPRR